MKECKIKGSSFCIDQDSGVVYHYPVEPGVSHRRYWFENELEKVQQIAKCIKADADVRKVLNGNVEKPGGDSNVTVEEVAEKVPFKALPKADELPLKREDWGNHGLTEGEIRDLENGGSLKIGQW